MSGGMYAHTMAVSLWTFFSFAILCISGKHIYRDEARQNRMESDHLRTLLGSPTNQNYGYTYSQPASNQAYTSQSSYSLNDIQASLRNLQNNLAYLNSLGIATGPTQASHPLNLYQHAHKPVSYSSQQAYQPVRSQQVYQLASHPQYSTQQAYRPLYTSYLKTPTLPSSYLKQTPNPRSNVLGTLLGSQRQPASYPNPDLLGLGSLGAQGLSVLEELLREEAEPSVDEDQLLQIALSQIYQADRLVKKPQGAPKNVPKDAKKAEATATLKAPKAIKSKVKVSEPVPLNLPPPQTNFDVQQERLITENLIAELNKYDIKPGKLSAEEQDLMDELGVKQEDLDKIMKLTDLPTEKDAADSDIVDIVNSLSEEDLDALTKMSEKDLEKFAEDMAKEEVTDLKLIPTKRKRRQAKAASPTYSSDSAKKLHSETHKNLRKRSKKTVAEKLNELQSMIDQLEETKQQLLQEMENVKRRAKERLEKEKNEKKSKRSIMGGFNQRGWNPRNFGSSGLVKNMMRKQAMLELSSKKSKDPEMSTKEIKEMAGAMKSMIDKIEVMVKDERAHRAKRKRSVDDKEEKEFPNAKFSFLDFGKDEQGSYTEFINTKTKRSLKSLFTGKDDKEEEKIERVQPTHYVPDFIPDPKFLSDRFESRELPPPVNPELNGVLNSIAKPTRRRRQSRMASEDEYLGSSLDDLERKGPISYGYQGYQNQQYGK